MPRRFSLRSRKSSSESSTVSTTSVFKSRLHFIRRKEPRKKVSFSPKVKTYTVDRHAEYAIAPLWYTRKDVQAIAAENQSAIQQYREHEFVESAYETFMGLESYLTRSRLKKKRHCICNAVLQAQRHFRSTGSPNMPEQIATVYKETMASFFF